MALSADAAMMLLREAMEGLLQQELVASTIFEALGEYGGEMPVDGRELTAFVEGPLERALARAVDEDTAHSVKLHLRPILATIVRTEPPPPPEAPAPEPQAHVSFMVDEDTAPLSREGEAYVLVLAASEALERRLRLALGTDLDTGTANGVVSMHAKILGHNPRLVLVDATDPPPYSVAEVTRALSRNTRDAVTVVWGSDEPFAGELAAAVETAPVGLDVDEGVGPLLDLVRSFGMPATAPKVLDGQGRPTPRIGTVKAARPPEGES